MPIINKQTIINSIQILGAFLFVFRAVSNAKIPIQCLTCIEGLIKCSEVDNFKG